MATAWPGTIPENALFGSIQGQFENNRAEFQPEVGPPIRRRRSSINIETITFDTAMTAAQVALLETFYKTTLSDGVTAFTRRHPRTGSNTDFTFVAPPTYTQIGFATFRVSFQMRTVP